MSLATRPLPQDSASPIRLAPSNDNSPRIIALSGVAGSGKSTASAYLQSKGYRLVKFADPLKNMLRAIGLSESQIEGDDKQTPTRLLQGRTPRHAMQTLGTEWGRECIGTDFWTFLWEDRVLQLLDAGQKVVVDDCRFENEAKAVRDLGGVIIRLEGRGGITGGHSSEKLSFNPDATLRNDGGIDVLHYRLEAILAYRGAA